MDFETARFWGVKYGVCSHDICFYARIHIYNEDDGVFVFSELNNFYSTLLEIALVSLCWVITVCLSGAL